MKQHAPFYPLVPSAVAATLLLLSGTVFLALGSDGARFPAPVPPANREIAEALARPMFEGFVRAMLRKEVEPSLALPEGTDFASYSENVLGRFANAALPYRCLQVATDGSQKLPQRILGTVRDGLNAGRPVTFGTLVVAAWLRAIWTGADDSGHAFNLQDPLTERLRQAIGATDDPRSAAERALRAEVDA